MSETHAWFNLPRRSFESRSHCFLPNGAWDNLFSEIRSYEPSPEPAPGLPHFGAYPQADLTPFTLANQHQACPQGVGGAPTNANVVKTTLERCGPFSLVVLSQRRSHVTSLSGHSDQNASETFSNKLQLNKVQSSLRQTSAKTTQVRSKAKTS